MQWVGPGILHFGIFQSTTEFIDIRGYLEQLLQYRQDEHSKQAERWHAVRRCPILRIGH